MWRAIVSGSSAILMTMDDSVESLAQKIRLMNASLPAASPADMKAIAEAARELAKAASAATEEQMRSMSQHRVLIRRKITESD